MRLIPDIISYLKAVFAESQRVVFTAFDIVGIVLFLFPQLAQDLVANESYARVIGGLIFFLSFITANFMLYRKLTLTIPTVTAQDISGGTPYSSPHYTISLNNVTIGEHGQLNVMGDAQLTDKPTSSSSTQFQSNTTIQH